MKILESQNALLSNYEVYQHLADQRKRNKAQNRRVPANAHQVMNEVTKYLSGKPSPLEKQEETQTYSPAAFSLLFEKLREANLPSELTKGELLSILNIRPSSTALLSTAIEDMEERFDDDNQNKIVDIIAEVLGSDESNEGGERADEMDADAVPTVENGY
ncbi:RNA polymerase Rpb4-domain-containing protein [Chaetomium tenue]|uniref:RNA polymerase Rpb4-domain-containing protein n=1 Tax=Chaetomium tenue TaxID=1854479 RepID=A0ACB7PG93_9PEZI|nr:RNA polymerase Rpb4-domain-containing protein [Chaetomium globosum]